ncbi:MAG: tRNA preQ1(34) S-adenosylmethionine ribosyltransferase-isomerase QueA [Candidatus Dojkabacteria bacterium]|nr:tRNA preQ1(34) S-adenosylmethionine ribosyltransferase-isomerase QueA [Candidatus Dojkabacteria bacterium]
MKILEFNYNLPEERIAKYPPKKRGSTKLLVVNRQTGRILNRKYTDISKYIKKGDVIVLNETKVRKQRTFFVAPNGREVQLLFLNLIRHYDGNEIWYCLIGRARDVKEGDILRCIEILVKVGKRESDGFLVSIPEGHSEILFEKYGHTPIPPYMKRKDNSNDYIRYNTVFAHLEGSVAAPTASLNLTSEILADIEKRGAKIAKIALDVGWGTFAPIREENIEDHKIHKEKISVEKKAVEIINNAKKKGGDIWAFGTTVARTLESVSDINGYIKEYNGDTELYIYPGYKWKCVNHLITNFHMPDSSLILLVSSFAGRDLIKKAYEKALKSDYKFLSYGDSMLII